MRGPEIRPIVIAAGGTGGHFYPAEALAAELILRGRWVVLMTDARTVVPRSSVFFSRSQYVLPGAGIAGRGTIRAGKAVFAMAVGVARACAIMVRIRPAAVVAFGGYPSVPPVLASRLLRERPPVILHEQNAVLGRANRFLARHARMLALSFENTSRVPDQLDRVVTGNPVRPAVMKLNDLAYESPDQPGAAAPGPIRLLVTGGSLGARVFSDIVPEAISRLPLTQKSRLLVTQQCRAEDLDRVRAMYASHEINTELAPFFADIAERLSAAHLVIARAGASTVAELATAGRPSILVPLPGAIDDHQSANARALGDAGAAWVMPQSGFTVEALAERLSNLFDNPEKLAEAASHAREVAQPGAADALANVVDQFINETARVPAAQSPSGTRAGRRTSRNIDRRMERASERSRVARP
jgi:UDP-N-acetylglucosamine--N-acetylmuramyl-(pentapeptide) pyrophosphoryl-undecaprenol N-acetylglucosamine transferase